MVCARKKFLDKLFSEKSFEVKSLCWEVREETGKRVWQEEELQASKKQPKKMASKAIIWISIAVQLISICAASTDEPLGRNYRKNLNNYQNSHSNTGKILSTSDTKISSVSYKPESNGKFSSFVDNSNLKTAASEEEKFSIGLGVLSPSYSQVSS